MNPEAQKYLAAIGRRGGKAKSAAKTAAARKANAARWRNHKPKRMAMTPNEKKN
jgi:phage gp16-like protein